MKPGINNLLWALLGAVLFGAMLFLALRFQLGGRANELALQARKAELAARIRVALASAAEAEKSAVLAVTDEESKAFADQARAATATADETRGRLSQLLQTNGTARENELLTQFSAAFTDYQYVDRELLELAVKNTNIKASALALGPAAQAMRQLDAALSRLVAKSADSSAGDAKKVMFLAASAQSAALRIELLLGPHIAEESDSKMDELEAEMGQKDEAVRKAFKGLAAQAPGDLAVAEAASAYARFTELRTQILKLSRENTNVRSLSLSLNEKRKVSGLCQATLADLEKAIGEAGKAGRAKTPVSPR